MRHIAVVALIASGLALAQVRVDSLLLSGETSANRVTPPSLAARQAHGPELRLTPLTAAEMRTAVQPQRSHRIGMTRKMPQDPRSYGRWSGTAGDRPVWHVEIVDPDAIGQRVHFRKLEAAGGRLWVHNGNPSEPQSAGPFDAPTFGDGELWTDIIFGDRIVIEFEAGSETTAAGDPPFEIAEVVHIWEFMGRKSPLAAQVDTSCFLDAVCYTNNSFVASQMPTVVYLVIANAHTCTGTVLNDQASSHRPWMLTAAHCITSAAEAAATLAYGSYQSAFCGDSAQPNPARYPPANGSTLLSRGYDLGNMDFSFVLLSSIPGGTVGFSGWDTATPNLGTSLLSISHPRNLPKRFAQLQSVGQNSTSMDFHVFQGSIDHGSSGSALFDTTNHLRAVLSTGYNVEEVSACSVPINDRVAGYTKFGSIFPYIKDYLNSPPPAADPATITSPAAGVTLPGSAVTFSWTSVSAGTEYVLGISRRSEGSELYFQGQGLRTSASISGLPTDGSTLYATIWSHINGAWRATTTTYRAANGGGGSPTLSSITSPTPGSILTGANVTFVWSATTNAVEYVLGIGRTPGGFDLYFSGQSLRTSTTVTVPTDGGTLYATIWTRVGTSWSSNTFTYKTANGGNSNLKAEIVSPAPGVTFNSNSVTFTWSAATGSTEYVLGIGRTPDANNVYFSGQGLRTSATVNNLPSDGSKLYVKIWSHLASVWVSSDYTYTAVKR